MSPLVLFIIFCVSFFCTSAISAAAGAGGGMLITAVLSGFIPAPALIPVQNLILLMSSGSRAVLYRKDINWTMAWPFILGLGIGSFLGAGIYVHLPEKLLNILLATVMLYFSWGPGRGQWLQQFSGLRILMGAFHGFLSSLTGVGGLLQGTFARMPMSKNARIGTFAVVISSNNIWRGIAYAILGINLLPYFPLILAAVPIAIAGSAVGKKFTDHISERAFDILFKTIVTLFAARLLYKALLSA